MTEAGPPRAAPGRSSWAAALHKAQGAAVLQRAWPCPPLAFLPPPHARGNLGSLWGCRSPLPLWAPLQPWPPHPSRPSTSLAPPPPAWAPLVSSSEDTQNAVRGASLGGGVPVDPRPLPQSSSGSSPTCWSSGVLPALPVGFATSCLSPCGVVSSVSRQCHSTAQCAMEMPRSPPGYVEAQA